MQFLPISSIGDQVPVTASAVYSQIDMTGLYSTGNDSLRSITLVDALKEIQPISYVYTLLSILIAMNLMAIYVMMAMKMMFNIKVYSKLMKTNWLHVIEAVFFQTGISPRHHLNRLVWISLVIGLFVIIRGYLANFIKVEKVAIVPKPTIDKIDSLLFEPEFKSHQVVMSKNLYFYDNMRLSSDTKLRHLHDRMMSTSDCSRLDGCNFVEFQGDVQHYTDVYKRFTSGIAKGNSVFLWNSLFTVGAGSFTCTINPETWSKVEQPKEPFASDILVWYYSQRWPSDIRNYMDYILQTINEFGFEDINMKKFIAIATDKLSQGLKSIDDWSTYACLDKADQKEMDSTLPSPMDMDQLLTTLVAFGWLTMAICLTLVIELVCKPIKRGLRSSRIIKKRKLVRRRFDNQVEKLRHQFR